MEILGVVLDIDYVTEGRSSVMRLTVKTSDGVTTTLFDESFKPHFFRAKLQHFQ